MQNIVSAFDQDLEKILDILHSLFHSKSLTWNVYFIMTAHLKLD